MVACKITEEAQCSKDSYSCVFLCQKRWFGETGSGSSYDERVAKAKYMCVYVYSQMMQYPLPELSHYFTHQGYSQWATSIFLHVF